MDIPNFTYLGKGFYVCRTQAGFKQAIRHFENEPSPVERMEVVGFPKSYPAFVSLRVEYRGYNYIGVRCMHVNELRTKLDEADSKPRGNA